MDRIVKPEIVEAQIESIKNQNSVLAEYVSKMYQHAVQVYNDTLIMIGFCAGMADGAEYSKKIKSVPVLEQ